MSKAISVSTGPIFTILLPNGRYFLDPVHFFRFLKGRCDGNQFSGKNGAKLPTPLHLSLSQSKMEWDIATSMGVLTAQVTPLSQAAQLRQPCVNSHKLSQWEPVIFDPPQNRRPLTDR